MYMVGKTLEDKEESDRVLLNNIVRVINHRFDNSGKLYRYSGYGLILQRLRRARAMTYYSAVSDFGGPAFWKDKNKPENYRRVEDETI